MSMPAHKVVIQNRLTALQVLLADIQGNLQPSSKDRAAWVAAKDKLARRTGDHHKGRDVARNQILSDVQGLIDSAIADLKKP